MSIALLKKVALVGLTEEKLGLLEQIQTLGLLHITPMRSLPVEQVDRAMLRSEVAPERLNAVLRYLKNCPSKRRQITRIDHFNPDQITGEVEANQAARLQLIERCDFLKKRIADLSVWGNFRVPEEGELGSQRLWFYLIPNHRLWHLNSLELPWQVVHRDHRNSYVIVISEKEPSSNQLPVPRTHTGSTSLAELERELENYKIELEEIDASRKALSRWIYLLQCSVAGIEDREDRRQVEGSALDAEEVFAISGWIDARRVPELEAFSRNHAVALQITDPNQEDTPPTLLKNSEMVRGGESIVQFFQMPGYSSWDPSRVVFFSFAAFFALIMSDAGYALVLLVGTALFWNKLGETPEKHRLRTLLLFLGGSSLLWGVLVGSYFGYNPDAGWLDWLQIVDLNDFDLMMKLSIFIGVAHLVIANLMMARVRWPLKSARAALGWALLVSLSFIGWLVGFNPMVILLCLGALGMILVYSGSQDNWRQRGLSGLYALTNLTKAFGDVLSYLRLFALGLASASLALTFNQLADQVQVAQPGIGFVLSGIILLLGHSLNFALTVVSGVIHGLRLNLIEFYNWSLADEGYAFEPFAKREVTPWTT